MDRLAVEVGRAVDLEREIDRRELRIEVRRRVVVDRCDVDQLQRVGGIVAGGGDARDQHAARIGHGSDRPRAVSCSAGVSGFASSVRCGHRPFDLDVPDALAAGDPEVAARTARTAARMQLTSKRALAQRIGIVQIAIDNLEIIDAVERRDAPQPPRRRSSSQQRYIMRTPPRSRWKVWTCTSSVRRTTYCTVTESVASLASTRTSCTAISSPSHCCSAPCTSICVALASSASSARTRAASGRCRSRAASPARPER